MNIITDYAGQAFKYSVDTIKNQDPRQLGYRVAVFALGVFMITQEVARPLTLLAVTALSPTVGVVGVGIVVGTVAANFLTKALVVMSFPKILAGTSSLLGLFTLHLMAKKIEPLTLEPIVMKFISKNSASVA